MFPSMRRTSISCAAIQKGKAIKLFDFSFYQRKVAHNESLCRVICQYYQFRLISNRFQLCFCLGCIYRDGRIRSRLRLHLHRGPGRRWGSNGASPKPGDQVRSSDDLRSGKNGSRFRLSF